MFALQEKVLDNLLEAMRKRPLSRRHLQAIDPLQQTISAVVQQFLSHPQVERKRAAAIEFLHDTRNVGRLSRPFYVEAP